MRGGVVLVSVLLLTLATWLLLAALLTTSFLHFRLAVGAERAAVAGAAAEAAVATALAAAERHRGLAGDWPATTEAPDVGACALDVEEAVTAGAEAAAWRVRVRSSFEGAAAWREGTSHAAP